MSIDLILTFVLCYILSSQIRQNMILCKDVKGLDFKALRFTSFVMLGSILSIVSIIIYIGLF